jgi:hypothetical protein
MLYKLIRNFSERVYSAYLCICVGGTPYCEVLTRELPARVMRGLLLPQLPYISDDLYQLMLQCWQVDLDERPTFEQILVAIQELMEYPAVSLYITIQYCRYFVFSSSMFLVYLNKRRNSKLTFKQC